MSINFAEKTEFQFIETVRRRYALQKIGDDCAVLPKDSKTDLVITTDLLVEDIDFKLEWTTPEFVGHKSLAVSLSDVAAMGAKPVWAMLSIGVPEKVWKTDFVEKFYDGWFALANEFNVELIGGDVSKTSDKIVIDSIAAGETKRGKAILRSGAKAGDLIFLTGELGGAAAGLRLLEKGERYEKSKYKNLLLRQLKPNPQTEIGQILGAKNLATSMIDSSDGLVADLNHICRESKVGAKIFDDKIPDQFDLEKFHSLFNSSEMVNFSLYSGEDFELLFTVNPKKKFQVEKELKKHQISQIGSVTPNAGIIELISKGKSEILQAKGFRHF
ncbi:MAG: Thiamine-monophosphate kinase [uncultured Pyrinomonadaceae bacterium]|uniref:Thiamine-monophosphate kinase n=1 Tax=uncultured Pyrinomonadaceae bacterium TaxID=2283094 RepID=A0A6J4NWX3_9BACT|nr:MAG: Thiamine-monophosphate kinase [uncultured Pyrinomonadaceae bacterium]